MGKEDHDYRKCPDCGRVWRFDYVHREGRMLIRTQGNPRVRQRCNICLEKDKLKRAENGRRRS